MDFEKYTDRSRGFIQAAQTLALRSNHQRLTPEHLLKSEEHTSELQSLMRISYAVFCLKKKTNNNRQSPQVQESRQTKQTLEKKQIEIPQQKLNIGYTAN